MMNPVFRYFASAMLASTVLTVLSPGAASAAGPIPFEQVDVTVMTEGSRNILVVTGELPADTKLPADIELHLPAGKELQWAGEILGGDLGEDIDAKPRITRQGFVDVYAFTLTKTRTGQVEVVYPEVVRFDGRRYNVNLAYLSPTALDTLTLNVRLPQSAKLLSEHDGAERSAGYETYDFYHRTVERVKAGDKHTLSFAYEAPGAAATTTNAPSSDAQSSSLASMIVMAVAVAGFLLAGRAVNSKMRARRVAAAEQPECP